MKLRQLPLLTDENVDPDVVAGLRRLGFDVLDVVESGRAGAGDVELLREATSRGRVVLTHDADFGTLAILQKEPLVGLIFLGGGKGDGVAGKGTERIDSFFGCPRIQIEPQPMICSVPFPATRPLPIPVPGRVAWYP